MRPLFVKLLLRELPKLEVAGVVDAATAERLRTHYGTTSETGRRLMVAIFAVFGAVLIGGGVILLLAHNWESFGRGTRAAVAPEVLRQQAAGRSVGGNLARVGIEHVEILARRQSGETRGQPVLECGSLRPYVPAVAGQAIE